MSDDPLYEHLRASLFIQTGNLFHLPPRPTKPLPRHPLSPAPIDWSNRPKDKPGWKPEPRDDDYLVEPNNA